MLTFFPDLCGKFNGKAPMEITINCIKSSKRKQRQLLGKVSYFVQLKLS